MTLHPLGRADLAVYALAFTLGLQLVLLAHALNATADARRRWRRERHDAGAYIDQLHDELHRALTFIAPEDGPCERSAS